MFFSEIQSTSPKKTDSFYSLNPTCSQRARITQAALAVIAVIFLSSALYGYLGDPSWLIGAHLLTASAALSFAIAGLVVLAGCSASCGAVKSQAEQPKKNDTPVHNIHDAFTKIFGENLPQPQNSAEYRLNHYNSKVERESRFYHSLDLHAVISGWNNEDDLIYGVYQSREKQFYALIKVTSETEPIKISFKLAPSTEGYELKTEVCLEGGSYSSSEQKVFSQSDVSFFQDLIQMEKGEMIPFIFKQRGLLMTRV